MTNGNPSTGSTRSQPAVSSGDALPTGEVTFCFTDIQGSTSLFHALGHRCQAVLAESLVLQRRALSAHGGVIVKSMGDGLFAAFDDAVDAMAGALAVQAAVLEHQRLGGVRCSVRVGLHTGPAEPLEGDYSSLTVHEAARVTRASHGSQVLISAATARAARPQPPEGVSVRSLGTFWLAGFNEPRELLQLCRGDLPLEFPPPTAAPVASTVPLYQRRTAAEALAGIPVGGGARVVAAGA